MHMRDVSGNQFGAVFFLSQPAALMWVLYILAALFYGPPSPEKGFKEATCRSYALTPLIRTFFRARRDSADASNRPLFVSFLRKHAEKHELCLRN
jgi:hypothetical protein